VGQAALLLSDIRQYKKQRLKALLILS